jgi:hypothetical protein
MSLKLTLAFRRSLFLLYPTVQQVYTFFVEVATYPCPADKVQEPWFKG